MVKEADKKVVEDKGVPPYEKKITGRILVVDDEEVILSLLSEVIGSFGFEVDTSITAKTALEKVNEKGYDLIISDFKMPEMSGDRLFAEIIKTNPSYRGKIVFITGDILNPETQRFLKETGSLCLPKPFKIEEIKEFISLL